MTSTYAWMTIASARKFTCSIFLSYKTVHIIEMQEAIGPSVSNEFVCEFIFMYFTCTLHDFVLTDVYT